MQEVLFLKHNAAKWQEFEELLAAAQRVDPDTLARLFIELADDLSYARTYYPQSPTVNYLNGLTSKVHQKIYRNKKETSRRFFSFWACELPQLFAQVQRELLYACVIFALAVFVGVVSAANDDSFVRMILGDAYVNMTLANMEDDDPLAVYKSMHQIDMFLGLTVNNIYVSFMAFSAGVLFSFGAGYVLFNDGVMLGVFHYLFYENGLLSNVFLTVWIHGTLEISAIVIAGSAGLVVGNSILFPGTYSRLQSFRSGAAQGIKIVIGLVPLFVAAGFLEAFVTRHNTEMPMWLSLSIILTSFVFVLWYFIIYPLQLKYREEA